LATILIALVLTSIVFFWSMPTSRGDAFGW
jgi:hypothetical protein